MLVASKKQKGSERHVSEEEEGEGERDVCAGECLTYIPCCSQMLMHFLI